MKLLIVEDEKVLSKALAKGLGKLGYAVDCAGDGEEALALYEVNAYDLMVLDLNLPKIDGLTVLRHIRKQDPSFRILILSARNSAEDLLEHVWNSEAKHLGMKGLLLLFTGQLLTR